jgi:hypothetical protein
MLAAMLDRRQFGLAALLAPFAGWLSRLRSKPEPQYYDYIVGDYEYIYTTNGVTWAMNKVDSKFDHAS